MKRLSRAVPASGSWCALESLESRVVLAATEVAAVGLSFRLNVVDDYAESATRHSYVLEGSVSGDNTLDYAMQWDGATGPLAPTPPRTAQVRLRDDGTFDYESPMWRGLASEWGSQFLPQDGYAVGWWRALTEAYLGSNRSPSPIHAEQQFIVPLAPVETPMSGARGTWTYSMIEYSSKSYEPVTRTGALHITSYGGVDAVVAYGHVGGGSTESRSRVISDTGGSRFMTKAGVQYYMASDGATLIFADLSRADGSVSIGVAVRWSGVTMESAADTYRVMVNRGEHHMLERTLTLNEDGTYGLRGGEFSEGIGVPDELGTWLVHSNSEIVLRPASGEPEMRWRSSASGSAIVLASSSRPSSYFMLGTRATLEPIRHAAMLAHGSIGDEGQGLVFVDRTNSPWTVADVAAESGGPSATGELVTWFDPESGLARGAAATDRGLTIYSELANGAWTYEVLAESLGTGTFVRPEIATTLGPGGLVNIFGLSPEGDLIRYVQSSGRDGGWHEWNFTENRLEAHGLATPSFMGSIVATRTLWGGMNIAGIDANGDLVTVWTTRSAGRWFVSNLSSITGIDRLWNGLDIVAAGRHGIHFSAIDTGGKLTVLSWQPWMAGWTASTFTTSPPMQYGEVAMAFDGARRALLITSLRLDSGALMVHLVPLSFVAPTPFKATISGFGVPMERRVRSGIDIQVGSDYRINVFGVNFDDQTVLFTAFEPLHSVWTFENLTDIT